MNTVVYLVHFCHITLSSEYLFAAGLSPKLSRSNQSLVQCFNFLRFQILTTASIPKSLDIQVSDAKARLFSQRWLAEPDAEGGFPTNGDRFAAQEVTKRQDVYGFTRRGFMLQAIAAGWHSKNAQQLKALGDAVGRERIQVLHGSEDKMITAMHGEVLAEELGGEAQGVKKVIMEGCSHVLLVEARKELRNLIAAMVHAN